MQPKITNAEKPKHDADVQQSKKQLWGTEADGGWYASSAKIVDRFFLQKISGFFFFSKCGLQVQTQGLGAKFGKGGLP